MPANPPRTMPATPRARRLLQDAAVTTKIHATANIDEIMLELSGDLCRLFNCDRLTIYAIGEDRRASSQRSKTGPNSFKDPAAGSPTERRRLCCADKEGRQYPRR